MTANAQESIATSTKTLIPNRSIWRFTTETLRLPGNEKMGLAAGDLLYEVNENTRLGVGAYGAIRGERGGFITLGAAGELRQRLSHSWSSHEGLFVGAGGGHGGYSLAGGGLMLRQDVGLSYETSRYGNFGVGVSHVRFPWGVIASTQPYILYEHSFYTVWNSGWVNYSSNTANADVDAVPSRTNEIAAVIRHYSIPATAGSADAYPKRDSMQLLGVEWLTYPAERWFIKLESEGAMGGESKGYMQVLAGAGYRLPLTRGAALKFAAAAGPAGGGGVDTGGGLLLDAGVSLQQAIAARTALEFSVSQLCAPSSSFRAKSAAVKLNYQFGVPVVSSSPIPWGAMRNFDAQKFRLRVASQTYFKADPRWRDQYAEKAVSNLGVQVDYFFSQTSFITGQGLAAYAGEAGAYMTGQLGMGKQWSVAERWFVEGEGLLGAAGGGGLEVGAGLVAQANVSLGYRLTNALVAMATTGRIQALQGNFKANVVGVSMAYQFTAFAR